MSKEHINVGFDKLYPDHMKIEQEIEEENLSDVVELLVDKKMRKTFQNFRQTIA